MESNIHKMSCSREFDSSKCIKCTKCVQRCKNNCVGHLAIKGEGKEKYMEFSKEQWLDVLRTTVPPKTIDVNTLAFEKGYNP